MPPSDKPSALIINLPSTVMDTGMDVMLVSGAGEGLAVLEVMMG